MVRRGIDAVIGHKLTYTEIKDVGEEKKRVDLGCGIIYLRRLLSRSAWHDVSPALLTILRGKSNCLGKQASNNLQNALHIP